MFLSGFGTAVLGFAVDNASLLTAGEVGVMPMIVNFTFFVAYISMGAAFVFLWLRGAALHLNTERL